MSIVDVYENLIARAVSVLAIDLHNPRTYPLQFGLRFVRLIPALIASAWQSWRTPPLLEETLDAKHVFRDMTFDDLWEDTNLVETVIWLRGSKHLRIPDEWRPFLPSKIEKGF